MPGSNYDPSFDPTDPTRPEFDPYAGINPARRLPPAYNPQNPSFRFGSETPMQHGVPKSLPYGNRTPLQLPGARPSMPAGVNSNGPGGLSLNTPPRGAVSGQMGGGDASLGPNIEPEIIPPGQQPIRPGRSVGPFTNPSTDAQFRPAPGAPSTNVQPSIDPAALAGAGGVPWWMRGIANAPLALLESTSPAQAPGVGTNDWNMRPSGIPPSAAPQPVYPPQPDFPTPPAPPDKPKADKPRPAHKPTGDVSKPQVPNLGYYSPLTGNARGGSSLAGAGYYQKFSDPNDPRMFKGPLAVFGG